MGKLVLSFLFVAVIASAAIGLNAYLIERDITGWQVRAVVSSEPNDMAAYLAMVNGGMIKRRMTQGHAALIWKTPSNDMSLIHRAVAQQIEQANVLTTMDRSSAEYQTGLDNLRDSIKDLDLLAFKFWSCHSGLFWFILCTLGWALFVGFGIIWVDKL